MAHVSRDVPSESPPTSCFTEDGNGDITRKFFATPEELADHLKNPPSLQKERNLYVFEGLPIEYVQIFGSHFDVDANIFDSHATRKSGQLGNFRFAPRRGEERNERKVRAFALDYPEMTAITSSSHIDDDLMLPYRTIDIFELASVNLCHMTLVSFPTEDGGETLLLLLENLVRVTRGVEISSESYSILARALENLPEEQQHWKPSRKHDSALTLAEGLLHAVESPGGVLFWDYLTEIATDIALRKWRVAVEEFIEDACASRLLSYHEIHKICDLLESNIWSLDGVEATRDSSHGARMFGFIGLMKRMKRYTELFVWGQLLEEGFRTKESKDDEDNDTDSTASSKSGVHIRGGEVVDKETRQSINRVTYLGGVLLPFSIIAAIFSMGGNYQPGGNQFFIFWVIAIPICMLTTALIYADSIRRMTLEQFAHEYGPAAVKEDVDDMVASSISDSEIISYKAGIKERLASRMPGPWNRRRSYATSSSSGNRTDSDSDDYTSSTNSNQLPPELSIDGDLLVRKKKKKEPRSWSWRFWRRKPLDKTSDLENVPPSPTYSTPKIPSPPTATPPAAAPPSPPLPPQAVTPGEAMPSGSPPPESFRSDHSPIAGPAPPQTPSTSPSSPIPAPDIPDLNLDDDFSDPHDSHPTSPSIHPTVPDPAEIPLPPSPDSTSDDWRERDSSEIIRRERSPLAELVDSDYATDRERRSLERRMRDNDELELRERRRRGRVGSGGNYKERIIEREIIYDRRRRSEHFDSSEEERKLILERTTRKFVEEQETGGTLRDDDDTISEDRGRRRRRPVVQRSRRGTYYSYPRRADSDVDPTEVPLPPSPEELTEEGRAIKKLEKERFEYLKKLKEEENWKRKEEAGGSARKKKRAVDEELKKWEEEEHARWQEYMKKRTEENHARKRAEEEYIKKKLEEEKEAAARRAAKGKERAYSPIVSDSKKEKPAIKFKDAVGRKFTFPFHLVSTWAGMEELVKQAFLHVDVIGPHVMEGHYDLIGPEGEIILPQVWESVVEPGWSISMQMWPMPEPEPRWRPGGPGPPPPPRPAPWPPASAFPNIKPGYPGGLAGGSLPKKKSGHGHLGRMAGPLPSKSSKKKPPPVRFGPPPPAPPTGRRGSDEVIVIEDPPTKIHRRQTGMSEKHKYGTSGGGIIGGPAKPNEELGWIRALGTIVGVKPGMQVKKRSGGSSSGSSFMEY